VLTQTINKEERGILSEFRKKDSESRNKKYSLSVNSQLLSTTSKPFSPTNHIS